MKFYYLKMHLCAEKIKDIQIALTIKIIIFIGISINAQYNPFQNLSFYICERFFSFHFDFPLERLWYLLCVYFYWLNSIFSIIYRPYFSLSTGIIGVSIASYYITHLSVVCPINSTTKHYFSGNNELSAVFFFPEIFRL